MQTVPTASYAFAAPCRTTWSHLGLYRARHDEDSETSTNDSDDYGDYDDYDDYHSDPSDPLASTLIDSGPLGSTWIHSHTQLNSTITRPAPRTLPPALLYPRQVVI
jgi:hypothetical protein